MAVGTELMARSSEIGLIVTRAEGKTLPEAKGRVCRASQVLTCLAAEAPRETGDHAQNARTSLKIHVRLGPLGVVIVITSWKVLVATPSWKIAPALTDRTGVVWKPANLTPALVVALTDIIPRQDIPPGLFNLGAGRGRGRSQRRVEPGGVVAISVTGPVAIGRAIAVSAGIHMTEVQLEMRLKRPMLTMDDADMRLTAGHAAFGGKGPKATAAAWLIVHSAMHQDVAERLPKTSAAFRLGQALKKRIQIGPVVSAARLVQNLEDVALGRAKAAERLTSRQRRARATERYVMAPTVCAATSHDMRLNRDQRFAPIACIVRAHRNAKALATVSAFGLPAEITTRSPARACHFREPMRAGCVMVTLPTVKADDQVPSGAWGASNSGPRARGSCAAEFRTGVKTSQVAAGVSG